MKRMLLVALTAAAMLHPAKAQLITHKDLSSAMSFAIAQLAS